MNSEPAHVDEYVRVHHGRVTVGSLVLAERPAVALWPIERLIEQVRERTPEAWWRRAADIENATNDLSTAGPLGLGVDFFADNLDVALPPEVRDAIQDEAYEAAREVILDGIAEHLRLLHPVAAAVRDIAGREAARDVADGCTYEGCCVTQPHHHREDADWGEYLVFHDIDGMPGDTDGV